MEFYESEVPQYRAVQEYLDEIESAYYMGSGFDTTPGRTLDAEVLNVDHYQPAVDFLEDKGFEAELHDVTEYNPDRDFDLIIISHLPFPGTPLIEPNLAENGSLICRTDGRARKIEEEENLELEAVYHEKNLVTHEPVEPEDSKLYLFRR